MEKPLKEYTLNIATFGLNCTPYLAIRALTELADLEQAWFSLVSKLLKVQTYVDDILGSSTSISAALTLQKELINLLKSGGFELQKWASNSTKLLPPFRIPAGRCHYLLIKKSLISVVSLYRLISLSIE